MTRTGARPRGRPAPPGAQRRQFAGEPEPGLYPEAAGRRRVGVGHFGQHPPLLGDPQGFQRGLHEGTTNLNRSGYTGFYWTLFGFDMPQ